MKLSSLASRTSRATERSLCGHIVRVCGVASLLIVTAQCDDSPIALDGSTIDLTVGSTVIAADGGTTSISALLTESDGRTPKNGTIVVFMASGGELCKAASENVVTTECTGSTILPVETTNGVATAVVRAGLAGTLTVDARSGAVKATPKTITVASLVAPPGAKVVLQSEPDTIVVGGSSRVRAFITTADGAAVPSATRVVFGTTAGTLSRTIVLTQDGLAEVTLHGTAPGQIVVSLASGALRASDTIVVREATQ